MGKKRWIKIFLTGFVVFSLAASSGGGAFATVAQAATPGSATHFSWRGNAGAEKTILGQMAALGLLTVVIWGGHGNSSHDTWVRTPAPQFMPVMPSVPEIAPSPAPVSKPGPAASGLTADEQQEFSLLNADRAANGLPPLRINSQLTSLAGDYAQDMINRHYFAHNNPEGQSPFDRMRARGISFGYAGENLAINTSVPNAEQAFMNSPGHRANILNPHYTQVGVGVRYSAGGSVYVVQEFTDG